MLKVIKKPTVVLTVFMAAMATSCTNDDYSFFGDDDLNLNSQIPMTRSGEPESNSPNGTVNEDYIRGAIPLEENRCYFYALTDIKAHDYFKEAIRPACDDESPSEKIDNFYRKVVNTAKKDSLKYGWDKDSMTTSGFAQLGVDMELFDKKRPCITDPSEIEQIVNDPDARESVAAVSMRVWDSSENKVAGHFARVSSINENGVCFSGYNPQAGDLTGGQACYEYDQNCNQANKVNALYLKSK